MARSSCLTSLLLVAMTIGANAQFYDFFNSFHSLPTTTKTITRHHRYEFYITPDDESENNSNNRRNGFNNHNQKYPADSSDEEDPDGTNPYSYYVHDKESRTEKPRATVKIKTTTKPTRRNQSNNNNSSQNRNNKPDYGNYYNKDESLDEPSDFWGHDHNMNKRKPAQSDSRHRFNINSFKTTTVKPTVINNSRYPSNEDNYFNNGRPPNNNNNNNQKPQNSYTTLKPIFNNQKPQYSYTTLKPILNNERPTTRRATTTTTTTLRPSNLRPDYNNQRPSYQSELPSYTTSKPVNYQRPDYTSNNPDYNLGRPTNTRPDYTGQDYSNGRPNNNGRPEQSTRPDYNNGYPDNNGYPNNNNGYPSNNNDYPSNNNGYPSNYNGYPSNNNGYQNNNNGYPSNNNGYPSNNNGYPSNNNGYPNNNNGNSNYPDYNNERPTYSTHRPGVKPTRPPQGPPITNKPTQKPVFSRPGSDDDAIRFPEDDDSLTPELVIGPDEDKMTESQRRRYIEFGERLCSNYKAGDTSVVAAIPLLPSPTPVKFNISECGPSSVPLVVGGKVLNIEQMPHNAALGWRNLQGGGYSWKCGGSLISAQFVLTAGHCATQERDDSVFPGPPRVAQLGSSYINDPGALTVRVAKSIKHPKYKPPRSYYDLAVLKLASRVTFSEVIKPACIGVAPPVGQAVIATGWGRTEFGGDPSEVLRGVSLPIWDMAECGRVLGSSRRLPDGPSSDSQICAGERAGGKDTCQGDSGGPIQTQDGCVWRVVGVTSLGRACGAPGTPALYAIAQRVFIAAVLNSY